MMSSRSRRFGVRVGGMAIAVWMCGVPIVRPLEAPLAVAHAEQETPFDEATLWLAPPSEPRTPSDLARALSLMADDRAADAVPILVRQTGDAELGAYAHLHLAQAYLALGNEEDAIASLRVILEHTPGGYLGEAALSLLADGLAAEGKWVEAAHALQALTGLPSSAPQRAYLRLGQAAEKQGDKALARGAYTKIYYDWPLSAEASDAEDGLARVGAPTGPEVERLARGRAQALYAGRRYADARKAYQALRADADRGDWWAIDLRLAQCDFYLQHYAAAQKALSAYIDHAPGPHTEAEFFLLGTLRGSNRDAAYVAGVRAFVDANPGVALAETALNELGTYYIIHDDDEQAAAVFAEMYASFPTGAFADRAAWKAGWWAYKAGRYPEAIRTFETAAATMRRADYRPSWLYWAARAREATGDLAGALSGYRQTIGDYRNSYYGREAARAVQHASGGRPAVALASISRDPVLTIDAGAAPSNAALIQRLLGAGLYDDAIGEVRHVQLTSGNAPMLDATIAYALNRQGQLRPAINAMRRAYPQFMAAGGEGLPRGILSVIFPVAHWDLIQRYAEQHDLDPFLVAALVAQESTFQADIRSAANAWGLMQILPSTGRRYASKVGIRGFSTRRLTDPEVNVRIGTAYLEDLIDQFDDVASALAAYNAGESRVARWHAERPGVDREQFIDDIPFPETQNYVKRILGTAEDYRILYGGDRLAAMRESGR